MRNLLGGLLLIVGLLLFYLGITGRLGTFLAAITAPGILKEG